MDISKKYKKGYKVVTKYKLTSAFMIENAEVRYTINEWVVPPKDCGPLCVFDTFESACEFVAKRGNAYSIYSCLYKPANECLEIWYYHCMLRRLLSDLPHGTMLASKVKLLRRVG